MSARERVFKSHDNEVKLRVAVRGIPAPLANVTRITCELVEAGVTVDSATSPTKITWASDGEIILRLGGVSGVSGEQSAILTAYDPDHPAGQVLAHPEGRSNRVTLEFIA